MTTKQVTVTKYIACDGRELDTSDRCMAHERETRNVLEHDVYQMRLDMRELMYAINEARINARISMVEAQRLKSEVRSAKGKSEYCKMMSEYWRFTSEYNIKRRELFVIRRKVSMAIDNLYMWFGLHKKKSSVARLERRKRSLMFRRDHTPDQWRTPHKIRVSKLPHPARGED